MRDYKKIETWQLADQLAIQIYAITKKFPRDEMFGLTSQMRRATISVAANIAEGAVKKSKKEYLQFLYTSFGSLNEIGYYIHLSRKLNYINEENYRDLDSLRDKTAAKLYKLIESVEKEI